MTNKQREVLNRVAGILEGFSAAFGTEDEKVVLLNTAEMINCILADEAEDEN